MDQLQTTVKCVGIELGGTNCSVAIGVVYSENSKVSKIQVEESITFDTEDPQVTINFLIEWLKNKPFERLGIASFGPVCLDKQDQQFRHITSTPKLKWTNFPFGPSISQALKIEQYGFDTDVNACAQAEFILGKHNVKNSLAYITVGTGVGVGLIINGKCVHGLLHPEAGHIRVTKLVEDKDFKGVCRFHGDCLEGLCTNVSIAERLQCSIKDLPNIADDNPVWDKIGFYLASLCLNLTLITSVETIVLGGGVLNRKILYPIIRKCFIQQLGNYLQHPLLESDILFKQKYFLENIDDYIKEPMLGKYTGVMGAMLLEQQ